MVLLQTCCGFCTLSSGTVTSAVFILLANVVEIITTGAFMASTECGPISVITIGICILCIFSSMLVMIADDIEERSKFLPFIFVVPFSVLWFFVDVLVHLEEYAQMMDLNLLFTIVLVESSLEMYAVACVFSFYQDCARRSKFATSVSFITKYPDGESPVAIENEPLPEGIHVVGNTEVKHAPYMNSIPRSAIIGGPQETQVKRAQRPTSPPPPRPPLPKKLHVHWLMDSANKPELYDEEIIARQRELYEKLHYATVPKVAVAFSQNSGVDPVAPPRQKRSETSSLASYTR